MEFTANLQEEVEGFFQGKVVILVQDLEILGPGQVLQVVYVKQDLCDPQGGVNVPQTTHPLLEIGLKDVNCPAVFFQTLLHDLQFGPDEI